MDQVEKNTAYIKKYISPLSSLDLKLKLLSKVALAFASKQQRMDRPYCTLPHPIAALNGTDPFARQDAEMASLNNTPDAFKLYDVAVKYV